MTFRISERWRRAAVAAMAVAVVVAGAGAWLMGAMAPAHACSLTTDCMVDGGTYRVAVPWQWDGASPLPVAVYFHGHQSSAEAVLNNESLVRGFWEHGILLVVPNGRERTWSNVGAPTSARDEMAFMDAVRADVLARWPVDTDRLWATGFSQGASVVWDLACYRGGDYAAYVPFSGVFWQPLPEACPTPVSLRHVHGTRDTVFPMEGRQIGAQWHQGDAEVSMALLREANGCADDPDTVIEEGVLSCRVWSSCQSGKELRFCTFNGGHERPAGWIDGAWNWVAAQAGAD